MDNFSSVISIFIKLSITFYKRYTILMVLITVKTFPDFQWAYLKPCRGWNFLSHLTSPGLFVDDFLLVRQIQVLALAWKKTSVFTLENYVWTSHILLFFVTVVSWSPSGPCSFRLLLVDLKNGVRLCWLLISRPSIFSGVTVTLRKYRVQGQY